MTAPRDAEWQSVVAATGAETSKCGCVCRCHVGVAVCRLNLVRFGAPVFFFAGINSQSLSTAQLPNGDPVIRTGQPLRCNIFYWGFRSARTARAQRAACGVAARQAPSQHFACRGTGQPLSPPLSGAVTQCGLRSSRQPPPPARPSVKLLRDKPDRAAAGSWTELSPSA
jgi:hypothetical protein